jgi:hypothetical protein
MSSAGVQAPGSANATSIDLWKFLEKMGDEVKESLFKFVTWIIGFAAAILGFAIKEGFENGYGKVAHPLLVISVSLAGLLILVHATFIIFDHGRHINRTFGRADAARDGESSPQKIWDAGEREAQGKPIPSICRNLLIVVSLFALGFLSILGFACCGRNIAL